MVGTVSLGSASCLKFISVVVASHAPTLKVAMIAATAKNAIFFMLEMFYTAAKIQKKLIKR
jgi:hypothetical protein